ncbi:MAG: hypothetical protein IKI78_03570 [Clostridia bacterium]|nr:hypothetical protein [Clostridia bacterium]
MRKVCGNCGYKTGGKDMKCPICGGIMLNDGGFDAACDPSEEREWNGGYHNDFEEGRKTGEYCDPELEKYANGGEHYHGTQKTSASRKTEVFGEGEMPVQTAVILTLVISLFIPVVSPLIILKMIKGRDSDAARAARKAAIVMLILTVAAFALNFFVGYFNYNI